MLLPDIAKSLNLDSCSVIYKKIKEFNIQSRTIKESSNTVRQEKIKNTNIEKTGFSSNLSKGCPSRIKWTDRLLKEEGITNVFQRKDIKEKIKKTILTKYGVESAR